MHTCGAFELTDLSFYCVFLSHVLSFLPLLSIGVINNDDDYYDCDDYIDAVDFLRGPKVEQLRLQGVEHVYHLTALEGKIYFRSYRSVIF